MDLKIAREILDVIRRERVRRRKLLDREDPDHAWDEWSGEVLPFVNELCLTLLVAVWHQVERELTDLAARVPDVPGPIPYEDYARRRAHYEGLRTQERNWRIVSVLALDSLPEWQTTITTLRLLANCFKHEPSGRPDSGLLKHLNLPLTPATPLTVAYAALPESRIFLEGLATSLGVAQDGDYCAIAGEFVTRAESFLADVQGRVAARPVKPGPVRLDQFEG